jgi:hypothetical protein
VAQSSYRKRTLGNFHKIEYHSRGFLHILLFFTTSLVSSLTSVDGIKTIPTQLLAGDIIQSHRNAMDTTDIFHREVVLGTLPKGSSCVFEESSYFSRNGRGCSLPPPAEVRRNQGPRPSQPVRFEALNLIVKYGREITIAEGQCLWAIRRLLPYQVPVPEVYGWCEEGGEVLSTWSSFKALR